jgi:hypothetical protein
MRRCEKALNNAAWIIGTGLCQTDISTALRLKMVHLVVIGSGKMVQVICKNGS